jgi:D-methionine transport system permease protein
MLGWALVIGALIGLLLALLLVLCREGGLRRNRAVYAIVNVCVNIVRSMPFIITLVFVFPVTRLIVGKTYGSTAMLVPLVIYISPYMARLIENSLLEVSDGVIEAAQAMGATTWQIVTRFMLPEALSSLVLALTTGTVGLLGATAMAGYVGGGGVGDLALTYGYQRYNLPLLILTIVILVIFVQLLQLLGNRVSARLRSHR